MICVYTDILNLQICMMLKDRVSKMKDYNIFIPYPRLPPSSF